MATTLTPKSPAPPPEPAVSGPKPPLVLRLLDGLYHFLASVKLAVILIATLASTLAFATFYEKSYGFPAVQVNIYHTLGFALLLTMLGVNILCAALIRFPWKRRQTGFVITHSGLIVLLIGSFLSVRSTDEGMVYLGEGETTSEIVKMDHQRVLVQHIDPSTGRPDDGKQYSVPIYPGAFAWETEKYEALANDPGYVGRVNLMRSVLGGVALAILGACVWLVVRRTRWVSRPLGGVVTALSTALGLGVGAYALWMPVGPREDVLSQPGDPFRLVLKDYLPSSGEPFEVYQPSKDGVPALKLALLVQPPNSEKVIDAFGDHGYVAAANQELGHGTLSPGMGAPAQISFQYLQGPYADAALEDFLHPPKNPLQDRLARLYYRDKTGNGRVYEWLIDDAQMMRVHGGNVVSKGKTVTLPDSDLTVSLIGSIPLPTVDPTQLASLDPRMVQLLREIGRSVQKAEVEAAIFSVQKGDGPEITHIGWANLPMAPTVVPFGHNQSEHDPLLWIDYFYPPEITVGGPAMMGRLGQIDLAATEDGSLYIRAFGREGLQTAPSKVKPGQKVPIFGGGKMPMKVSVQVDRFLASARSKLACEELPLPPNAMGAQAVPAARLELTVGGESKEIWLRRSETLTPEFETVAFSDGLYRLGLDFERGKLGFDLTLHDFDPSSDPGTSARSAYRSDVTARDPRQPEPEPKAYSKLPEGQHFHFSDRPRQTYVKVDNHKYRPFDETGEQFKVADPAVVVQPVKKPTKIVMNYPMVHNGWTLYQSEYQTHQDRNGEPTGTFTSILTARKDPAWPVVYLGSLMIVLGTFVQFYMRAGVFSDGGKKEQERLEARKRKAERQDHGPSDAPADL